MATRKITRRALVGTAIAGAAALPAAANGRKAGSDGFEYEVSYTQAEWRERLDNNQYYILRDGGTEFQYTSTLWEEDRNGSYHCGGCDLHVFDAAWKKQIDKGWVFFEHSEPNAVLTGIDGPVAAYGMAEMANDERTLVEVHCRRCGSHLGHYLNVGGPNLHCINGMALRFEPRDA